MDKYIADGKFSVWWRNLYENNPDFKEFVDRCMRSGKEYFGLSLDEVLTKRVVQLVGREYALRPRENSKSPFSPVSPFSPNDICSCEDRSC